MLSTQDYMNGFVDGQAAPDAVPEIFYTPNASFYIDSAHGDDTKGDGTQAKPFKTYKIAGQASDKFQVTNPSALVEISLACGNAPVTESVGSKNANHRLYSCWKKSAVEDMALMGGNSPFVFLGGADLNFKGLRLTPLDKVQTNNAYAFQLNGTTGVTISFCDMDGYGLNVNLYGTNAVDLRLENNFIARSWLPGLPAPHNGRDWRSQGLYTSNTKAPINRGNTYYKNGYNLTEINMNDVQTWAQFQFSHGWYSDSYQSTAGIDSQNFYWGNACTGPMLRAGGDCSWDVLAYNGNAADVVGNGDVFSMSDSVILGFPQSYNPTNFPGWGGGIECTAGTVSLKRILFLSNNSNYGKSYPPGILLHNAPPKSTAILDSVTGIWPTASSLINNVNGNYSITSVGSNVRAPKPTDVLPTMLTFTGASTEDAGAEVLRMNKHNARFGAASAVSYFRRAAAAIL